MKKSILFIVLALFVSSLFMAGLLFFANRSLTASSEVAMSKPTIEAKKTVTPTAKKEVAAQALEDRATSVEQVDLKVESASPAADTPVEASPPPTEQGSKEVAIQAAKEDVQKFGRIFASMKPSEAAEVFIHLDNATVHSILLQLSPRVSSKIAENLPKERMAEITKLKALP